MSSQLLCQAPPSQIWEYGMAIGIFVSCGIGFWWLIRMGKDTFETISNDHKEAIVHLTSQHKDERTDWREDAKRREESLTAVLGEVIKSRDDA